MDREVVKIASRLTQAANVWRTLGSSIGRHARTSFSRQVAVKKHHLFAFCPLSKDLFEPGRIWLVVPRGIQSGEQDESLKVEGRWPIGPLDPGFTFTTS